MPLPQASSSRSFCSSLGVISSVFLLLACGWSANTSSGNQKKVPFAASLPSINFGTVAVGSSTAQTETLTNITPNTLTINQMSTTGSGFASSGLTPPVSLSPGQSYTFTVTFTPISSGAVAGNMTVGSVSGKNTFSVPLTGTGEAAGTLSVSPTSENFGNVSVGTSSTLSATLSASGASITVSGATSTNPEFSLSGISFPLTLTAGGSANFSVLFTPGAAGSTTGTFAFTSSANSPEQSLAGTGVAAPQHSVSLLWDASTSVVNGYNVYRGSQSGGPYSKVNPSLDPMTSYTDLSVSSGASYYYVTTAVDSSGKESAYSNEVKATIPSP